MTDERTENADEPTAPHRPKPYRVEVPLAAARDEVWKAVTQTPVLRQWFGWDYDGLDAEIRQLFVDEARLLAPERMGWADGSYLEVLGDDDSSTVRAAREGPEPDDPDGYDGIEEGWKAFLTQLRFLIEGRPTGPRRTVFLTGETTGRQALRLVDGDWTRVGTRVAWIVDADGRLVVIAGREPLNGANPGRIEITVSTYGLDDAAFDACRDDWAKRWASVATDTEITTADPPRHS